MDVRRDVLNVMRNMFRSILMVDCPQMWVWPQVPLGGPRPPPPFALGPLPPTSLGRPLPEPCKKSQGGWGEEGRGGLGGKGVGLREGSSNCNAMNGGGDRGGEPSKHQLGPDPHPGAPNMASPGLLFQLWAVLCRRPGRGWTQKFPCQLTGVEAPRKNPP